MEIQSCTSVDIPTKGTPTAKKCLKLWKHVLNAGTLSHYEIHASPTEYTQDQTSCTCSVISVCKPSFSTICTLPVGRIKAKLWYFYKRVKCEGNASFRQWNPMAQWCQWFICDRFSKRNTVSLTLARANWRKYDSVIYPTVKNFSC